MKEKKKIIFFIGGIYIGSLIFLVLNAISIQWFINPTDPSTFPNMGPGIRVFFFPVIGTILLPIGLLIEKILKSNFSPWQSFILGISYTSILLLTGRYLAVLWIIVLLMNPISVRLLLAKLKPKT